jgi:hypothetical protein
LFYRKQKKLKIDRKRCIEKKKGSTWKSTSSSPLRSLSSVQSRSEIFKPQARGVDVPASVQKKNVIFLGFCVILSEGFLKTLDKDDQKNPRKITFSKFGARDAKSIAC